MYIGNVMLLILNLPLVGLCAKMVAVPYYIMGPMILLFSFIGLSACGTISSTSGQPFSSASWVFYG